jgi:hypothetical protein
LQAWHKYKGNKMKKALIILLTSGLLIGCATTTEKKDLHPELTLANLEKNCNPDELWELRVMNVPGVVLKYIKCMKYSKLLAVSMPNTMHNNKVRKLSRELLVEHYRLYMERTNEKTSWSTEQLKEVVHKEWKTSFYLLKSQDKEG